MEEKRALEVDETVETGESAAKSVVSPRRVTPEVVDEDVEHDGMNCKSDYSEIPEIQSKGAIDASKDEDRELKNDEKPEDAEIIASKCSTEILMIGPKSKLNRRRRSPSGMEESVEEVSEKPAKKFKKTKTMDSSSGDDLLDIGPVTHYVRKANFPPKEIRSVSVQACTWGSMYIKPRFDQETQTE